MAYKTQSLELNQKMDRLQKDKDDEIDRIKWQADTNICSKDIQLDATQRTQSLTQQRGKQAEDTVNEYLADSIVDPTTELGKEAYIQHLKEEMDKQEKRHFDLIKGFRYRIKGMQDENEDL